MSATPSADDRDRRSVHAGLRAQVRAFLAEETAAGRIVVGRQTWTTFDRAFSLRCAERGYIAMTWPRIYGGHERSPRERYVVMEELLAGGAPLGSHWIADRQSGPQIMRNGTEALRRKVLPEIAAGRCTVGIGMSEPDSGSDLSSIRTQATKVDGGWRVSGRKVWTTNAHHADYMIVLCRTGVRSDNRYAGLSQIVVPMAAAGVEVRGIANILGESEFNEVVFDDCFVADDHLLGEAGDGWRLVMEELAFERSGPDRFLSSFGVLSILAGMAGPEPDRLHAVELGRLVARLVAVRKLSLDISDRLAAGLPVGADATIMKEIGTTLEQEIPDVARRLMDVRPDMQGGEAEAALAVAVMSAPSFSLRGGTREILKGIIARELGLR